MELGDDLHRFRAVDLQEDEDAGRGGVPGREDVLAHLEGGVAVGNGGELRADVHGACDRLAGDWSAVAGRRKGEAEAVADLERVDPELGLAGFDAEPRGARAGDAEVLAGTNRSGQLDGGGAMGSGGRTAWPGRRGRGRGGAGGGRGGGRQLGDRERGEEEDWSHRARLSDWVYSFRWARAIGTRYTLDPDRGTSPPGEFPRRCGAGAAKPVLDTGSLWLRLNT